MIHITRQRGVPTRLADWSPEQIRVGAKLARWSDYCESCEVGVGIPGLDQTLIMWAIRKSLRGTGVKVEYNQFFVSVDFYRRELRRLVPKPPALYFDPRVFSDRAVEVVVPEINFHYRFDEALAGMGVEVEYGAFIVNVMRGEYENNLEI